MKKVITEDEKRPLKKASPKNLSSTTYLPFNYGQVWIHIPPDHPKPGLGLSPGPG